MLQPTTGLILIITLLLGLITVAVAADTVAITARQAVVRARPDSKQAILDTVPQGTTFALLERRQGWYKVLLDDGREGWVAQSAAQVQAGRGSAGVSAGAAAAPPPSPTPSTSGGTQVAVGVYPQAQAAPKTQRNSIGMEFVLIPAGTFQMGSNDSDAYDDEQPVHAVRLTQPFYLGKYEVTQGQWQEVMGNNPSRFTGDPNRPVENVSWDDVQEFIRRLNGREGGVTYRLPTEAEWEYAARAGTTTRWSFGDDASQLGRYAWHDGNAGGQTHPVGQLQPNSWGLYDMHGNVWEWVQDWYGNYASGTAVDPSGPSSGSIRVSRGGSWGYAARYCRSAYRINGTPGARGGHLGFRLLSTW